MKKLSSLLLLCIALSCSKENPPGWVDQQRLNNQQTKDWLTLGVNQQMQHYSPLNQINKSNVQQLGFAWAYDASTHIGNVPRGVKAMHIMVDGGQVLVIR
jgi:quinohemoprotein ethanol dehydrogenase